MVMAASEKAREDFVLLKPGLVFVIGNSISRRGKPGKRVFLVGG
jgi:hypothetical protein